jgi:hypothetical protein
MTHKDHKEGVTNYERDHSHSHCWEEESPPCGLKGRHRCCLCEKPVLPSESLMNQIIENQDKRTHPLYQQKLNDWEVEFRDYFDKTLKPKKPTIGDLDRELCINFIRKVEQAAEKRGREAGIREARRRVVKMKFRKIGDKESFESYPLKRAGWESGKYQARDILGQLINEPLTPQEDNQIK